jgi:hypothetical protein
MRLHELAGKPEDAIPVPAVGDSPFREACFLPSTMECGKNVAESVEI